MSDNDQESQSRSAADEGAPAKPKLSPEERAAKANEALRRRLETAIERARSKNQRAQESAKEDLERSQEMFDQRIDGELLKVNLDKVERGQEEVELSGYDADGNAITKIVKLEAAIAPKRNMERYFHRARKGERGVKKAQLRIQHLETELTRLDELDKRLAQTQDEELSELSESSEFQQIGVAKKKQALPQVGEKKGRFSHLARHLRPRVFKSVDGWEILVGKGAQGNDHLTIRMAHGNDYFFHIAGVPGGHVILRAKRNQSPSLETLLDCAQLALHCSSRKEAWSADIHYTQKKNVTKPKGAKPGLVLVHSHKTLSIKRDEERLNRLLKRNTYQ